VLLRLTDYLIASIYHVPHVFPMLSSTNPVLFAYPTLAQLITFSSTRSFPLLMLSSALYVESLSFKIGKNISAVSRLLPVPKAQVKSKCNPQR